MPIESSRRTRIGLCLLLAAAMFAVGCARNSPPESSPRSAASPSLSPTPSPSPSPVDVASMNDPALIADVLVSTELRIRLDSTPEADYEALGRTQQAAYRKLVGNPDWRTIAIDRAPESLKEVIRRNIEAGAELRGLTKPVAKIPDWRIVAPPSPDELRQYYGLAQQQFGIQWSYLASIHLVESRFGRIRGTSSAGAQGPMQFLPSTWKAYGEGDINDPRDSIMAAGRYLKAAGAPGAMHKALYAYNHSERYVRAVTIYAEHMLALERTYLSYYHWQVYVRAETGDVLLEVGYGT